MLTTEPGENATSSEVSEVVMSPRSDIEELPPEGNEAPAEPEESEVKFDQSLLKKKRKEHTASELMAFAKKRANQETAVWSLYSELLGIDKRAFSCLQNPTQTPRTPTTSPRTERKTEDTNETKTEETKAYESAEQSFLPIRPQTKTKKSEMIEIARNYVLKMIQVQSYKETDVQGLGKKDKVEMFQEELDMFEQLQSYHETNQAKVRDQTPFLIL